MDVVPAAAEGEEEAPASDLVVSAEQVRACPWHHVGACEKAEVAGLGAIRKRPHLRRSFIWHAP